MARSSQSCVVIQWDSAGISALRINPERDGFAVLEHAVERASGSVGSESLRRFADSHALKDSLVYSILPREECTVRFMSLPSTEPAELDGMIRYAAEEVVPLRPEEVLVTHRSLGATADNQTRVMICVTPLDRIRQHMETLAAAGLDVEQVLLSTDCLVEAAQGTTGAMIVVDAGAARADLLALDNGVPCLDKAWVAASSTNSASELAHDIRRFGVSERTREEKSTVWFGGDSAFISSVGEALNADSFTVNTVGDRATGSVTAGKENLRGVPLVLLGAATRIAREGRSLSGLLPPEELHDREIRARRKALTWLAALAACALVAVGLAFGQAVRQRQAYIAQLESEVQALTPEARSVSAKRIQLNRLSRAVNQEGNSLDALAIILEQSPASGLNLSHYRYDARQGIEINGRALDLPYVDTFLDNLSRKGSKSLAAFAKASEVYRTERIELKQKVWDFAITVPFGSDSGEDEEAQ